MNMFWGIVAVFILSRFLGFGAQKPSDYARRHPVLDPRRALSGPMLVDGVLFGPRGRVVSRFTANMDCEWQGNQLTINEKFVFDSGLIQTRRWQLDLVDDTRLTGGATDIFGAVGHVGGDTLSLRYRLKLPDAAGGQILAVRDWMYALDNGTLVNRSQMRKFGIKVAELVATIRPAT